MEIYDYRNPIDETNDVYADLDTFTADEMQKVAEAVTSIKENLIREKEFFWTSWFDSGILPVLKDYAHLAEARLEIQRGEKAIISATITHPSTLDIPDTCMAMKSVLTLASYIGIYSDEDGASLVLIYDCRKLVSRLSPEG